MEAVKSSYRLKAERICRKVRAVAKRRLGQGLADNPYRGDSVNGIFTGRHCQLRHEIWLIYDYEREEAFCKRWGHLGHLRRI